MKHSLISIGLAISAAMCSPAFATTYYLSDCKTGAAQGCISGSAVNDGLSAATPKQFWSQLPPGKGGDRILFAKGGSWTDASMRIFIPTASADKRVVWDSYLPPWGGIAKPILTESRANTYLFSFDDGGQKAADGGYEIRNLDLRGSTAGGTTRGQAAVFAYWAVNDLMMEDLEISGFKLGVYAAHAPKLANGWENYRITLRNSYLHDNSAASFLGGAADLVIENNTLDHNGSAPVLDHDLYISSVSHGIIRNNTITNTTLNANGKCAGSVIVVHGAVDGLTVENNKIIQPQDSMPTCFGIEISGGYADAQGSEYFHDVAIRGNTVVDVGYIGIGTRGCTGCVIENNSIVWTAGGGNEGISMSVNQPSSLDELGTALTIRNNSIYMHAPASAGTGIRLLNEGTNHTITSNVTYFGPGATSNARCFDTANYTITSFKTFDSNLCYRAGGPVFYSPTYSTLAVARSAGFDINGLNVDPHFLAIPSAANCYSLKVTPNSSAASLGNLQMARQPVAACTYGT